MVEGCGIICVGVWEHKWCMCICITQHSSIRGAFEQLHTHTHLLYHLTHVHTILMHF